MNEMCKRAIALMKQKFDVVLLHGINKEGNCTCWLGANCTSSGKHPIYNGWQDITYKDESELEAEFEKYPDANIGIKTGGKFFVLDADQRHGGLESLKKYGVMKDTVKVSTGGGGYHYYFKIPPGEDIPNRVNMLPGNDIRSDGALVVAPGSRHKSGGTYEWVIGCSPGDIEIAEPDTWLVELAKSHESQKPMEIPETVVEGSRNATMTSIAGALRRKGLGSEAIFAALVIDNEQRCNPPLEESEIRTISNSVSRYKPQEKVMEWNEDTKNYLAAAMKDLKNYSLVFGDELLPILALASKYDLAFFAGIKTSLKGKVNLNDLEKAVKQQNKPVEICAEFTKALSLDGLDTKDMEIPTGWKITLPEGVIRISFVSDGEQDLVICFTAIVITRRFRNLDTGFEKLELAFFRDGHWKKILAPRSVVFNKNSIVRLSDNGLPVSSNNSANLIYFLSDFEQANNSNIPVVRSIGRLGWIAGGQFFPFASGSDVEYETDNKEVLTIMNGLTQNGEESKWLETTRKARVNPVARFLIAASFASVLLEPLHKRVFFIHLWHASKSGKTAALKLAIAAWGNPHKLMGSFNSTTVGLERMTGSLRNLPFAIDELQVLNTKRLTAESIIYQLSQGQGRTRGARDGGLQETSTWKNIIITTGEEAMLGGGVQDGANTRTFEIYAKPIEDITFASLVHEVSETCYGFAGGVFVKRLCEELKSSPGFLKVMFDEVKSRLIAKFPQSVHIDEVTVVCTGDVLSSVYVFGEEREVAMEKAIETALTILENNRQLTQSDNIERAWEMFSGWLVANKDRFEYDSTRERYGRFDESMRYLVIAEYANKALTEAGFSPRKVFRGFSERGYIQSQVDSEGIKRYQLGRSISGVTCRVFVVNLKLERKEEIDDFLS